MATVFMSIAVSLNDLDDQKPGVKIQTEGHTLIPPNSWNGFEDQEAFGSTPSHSPSQSLARKLIPDQPETWYCLHIQVTLPKDWKSDTTTPHTPGRCQLWKICLAIELELLEQSKYIDYFTTSFH